MQQIVFIFDDTILKAERARIIAWIHCMKRTRYISPDLIRYIAKTYLWKKEYEQVIWPLKLNNVDLEMLSLYLMYANILGKLGGLGGLLRPIPLDWTISRDIQISWLFVYYMLLITLTGILSGCILLKPLISDFHYVFKGIAVFGFAFFWEIFCVWLYLQKRNIRF